MRFKSSPTNGFQAFAVAGVNTVSFGITASEAARPGLLGFAVERALKGQRFEFRPGFKVFRSLVPHPTKATRVSTKDHPVQSFVWDDFTARPDSEYEYRFHPLRGTPDRARPDRRPNPHPRPHRAALQRQGARRLLQPRGGQQPGIRARVQEQEPGQTLPEEAGRGAPVAQPGAGRRHPEVHRLGRAGRHAPVLLLRVPLRPGGPGAQGRAIERGVNVQVIIDAKVNGHDRTRRREDPQGFPREDNLATIERRRLPDGRDGSSCAGRPQERHPAQQVHGAAARASTQTPTEVWTGSTNISDGRHRRPDQRRPLGPEPATWPRPSGPTGTCSTTDPGGGGRRRPRRP